MRKKLGPLVFRVPGHIEDKPVVLEHDLFKIYRKKLPETRPAVNHKFTIQGEDFHLVVGLFENGMPGEIFIKTFRGGSTVAGLLGNIGALTSIALQCGVPLDMLAKKFSGDSFEPSGFVNNPQIKFAHSITDYIFRWLAYTFLKNYVEPEPPEKRPENNHR